MIDNSSTSPPIPADRDWPLYRYARWMLSHDRDPRLVAFEDKLAVKLLAAAAGVPTVPTLAVLDVETLDLATHPVLQRERFVLKTNHGWNDLVFVERTRHGRYRLSGPHLRGEHGAPDANTALRRHFRWWRDRYDPGEEWAVGQIAHRQLFAEPWLAWNDDYKVHVAAGRAVFVHAFTGRFESAGARGGTFDRDWRLICPFGSWPRARSWRAAQTRFQRPAALSGLLAHAEAVVPPRMSLMRVDFFQNPDGAFMLVEAAAYTAGGRPTHAPGAEVALGRRVFDALSAGGFVADTGGEALRRG